MAAVSYRVGGASLRGRGLTGALCPGLALALCFASQQEVKGDMGLEELGARLNDRGYKNWLKAARCLCFLRDGLHPFTDQHMRVFHRELLDGNPLLRRPCQTSCRPRGTEVRPLCRFCSVQLFFLWHLKSYHTGAHREAVILILSLPVAEKYSDDSGK